MDNEFYLWLIRHGQSVGNTKPHLVGQSPDEPLSHFGKEQAILLSNRLCKTNMDFVFSSHYKRALDTAEIVRTGVYPIDATRAETAITKDLREYDAGDWLGKDRYVIHTPTIECQMHAQGNFFRPPNGESLAQVERRASAWLEASVLYNPTVIEKAKKSAEDKMPPPNVFAFTHGMTIKTLLHSILGFDTSMTWKITIDNTSISKLYYGKDGWRLININDTGHLISE